MKRLYDMYYSWGDLDQQLYHVKQPVGIYGEPVKNISDMEGGGLEYFLAVSACGWQRRMRFHVSGHKQAYQS